LCRSRSPVWQCVEGGEECPGIGEATAYLSDITAVAIVDSSCEGLQARRGSKVVSCVPAGVEERHKLVPVVLLGSRAAWIAPGTLGRDLLPVLDCMYGRCDPHFALAVPASGSPWDASGSSLSYRLLDAER
jgi:hypothetical protein